MYQELHKNKAHLGAERSYYLAKSRVYWPNMEKDIKFSSTMSAPVLLQKKRHITPHATHATHHITPIRECNFNIANGHHSY